MARRNLGWLILGSVLSTSAWADKQLNLTKGVTEISREVYDLHMFVLYICTAIGVVVFGAMFWSMIFHRKSKGVKPATFHESTKVEILWTAIPIVILIGMAIPATKTLIEMENNDDADVTIQVTGSQWKWHYKYFDQNIEFYSVLSTPREQFENFDDNGQEKGEHYLLEVDKPLVIPTNKKVRFVITSDDVIHSWWVPAFAVKQDANPGFINEAWTKVDEPGIYRGQCAELCGKDHGFMPIVVEVKSEADYQLWINEQHALAAKAEAAEKSALSATASMDELMALGESTYVAYCAACHQVSGTGLPPAFPALKASPIALGDVNEHIDIVYNGRAGTGMQGYGKQLSLKEIAAVVTYERNAWGNDTGDAVQASDVKALASNEQPSLRNATTAVIESDNKSENVRENVSTQSSSSSTESKSMATVNTEAQDTQKTYTLEQLMTIGEQVYAKACLACHQANGDGLPPMFPALKNSPVALGDINIHVDMVLNGSKKNPAMAAFSAQLSAKEIAGVVTYERNAWGNNMGDLIQPSAVADAKAASAK